MTARAVSGAKAAVRMEAPLVDAHAHIFTEHLPMAADAWTSLDYGFSAEQYLAELDAHGVHFGVISGISISGYYNDYMIEQLRQFRRLRGTVILPPTTDRYVLDRMKDDGVVGVRLQIWGRETLPDLKSEEYQLFLRRIRDLDWHIHVALQGEKTRGFLADLKASGVKIVIDHFGHPDPKAGPDCEGFQSILRAVQKGRTWVKLSSAYRLYRTTPGLPADDPRGEAFGQSLADELLREAGPDRLLWGSDCPFVGYEKLVTYQDTLDAFARWVPDPVTRRQISMTALKFYFS
jgi:predicted TIM-barrel fold metal-dependent hydrolase